VQPAACDARTSTGTGGAAARAGGRGARAEGKAARREGDWSAVELGSGGTGKRSARGGDRTWDMGGLVRVRTPRALPCRCVLTPDAKFWQYKM
jgi:hypothetical protein